MSYVFAFIGHINILDGRRGRRPCCAINSCFFRLPFFEQFPAFLESNFTRYPQKWVVLIRKRCTSADSIEDFQGFFSSQEKPPQPAPASSSLLDGGLEAAAASSSLLDGTSAPAPSGNEEQLKL